MTTDTSKWNCEMNMSHWALYMLQHAQQIGILISVILVFVVIVIFGTKFNVQMVDYYSACVLVKENHFTFCAVPVPHFLYPEPVAFSTCRNLSVGFTLDADNT